MHQSTNAAPSSRDAIGVRDARLSTPYRGVAIRGNVGRPTIAWIAASAFGLLVSLAYGVT